jgi:hypothetical protein
MGKCEIKKMSTSTVGLPRLSKIARALRDLMVAMAMAMARESEKEREMRMASTLPVCVEMAE